MIKFKTFVTNVNMFLFVNKNINTENKLFRTKAF